MSGRGKKTVSVWGVVPRRQEKKVIVCGLGNLFSEQRGGNMAFAHASKPVYANSLWEEVFFSQQYESTKHAKAQLVCSIVKILPWPAKPADKY